MYRGTRCVCVCVGEDCEVDSKVLQQRQQQHDIDVRLIIIIVIFFFQRVQEREKKEGGMRSKRIYLLPCPIAISLASDVRLFLAYLPNFARRNWEGSRAGE